MTEKWVGGVKQYTNQYDHTDNLIKTSLPDNSVYGFTYDENKRIKTYTEPSGFKLEHIYDKTGERG